MATTQGYIDSAINELVGLDNATSEGTASAFNTDIQSAASAISAAVPLIDSIPLGPLAAYTNGVAAVSGFATLFADVNNGEPASVIAADTANVAGNIIAAAGGILEAAGVPAGVGLQIVGDVIALAGVAGEKTSQIVESEEPSITPGTGEPIFAPTTGTANLNPTETGTIEPASTPTPSPSQTDSGTAVAPPSTDTGTSGNTGPIAPTQDGSVDPREILYALNQGDVALSAQSQIQYETSQGDTDLATQLQNALNQGNISNTAQVQDSQLQGSELQNQLEQTNPGLDAQIQSGLSSDITSQAAGTSSTDDTGTSTSPAATAGTGTDDTSGSGVPSPIPAYVPPASTPVNPVGNVASDPAISQSGATISSDASEDYNVTGNNLSENIGATNTSPVFINGNNDSLNLSAATSSFAITDNGQGTAIDLTGFMPSPGATLTINDFQNDATGAIILPSQYATASAAVAALQSDGQGGSILPLSNGASLHFVGDTNLTATSFTAGTA